MQRRNVMNCVSILSLQSPHQFTPTLDVQDTKLSTFVLAGGCFWCLDAVYQRTRGVYAVISGYIGGHTKDPNYREVCSGTTGHAEGVAVIFDPQVVPADVILDMFFTVHDPTTLNRQGYDVGTQYRSAMFPLDDAQRAEAEKAIARWNAEHDDTAVTTIEDPAEWYPAEDYHQEYWEGEGQRNPYCLATIPPKLMKLRKSFRSKVKA